MSSHSRLNSSTLPHEGYAITFNPRQNIKSKMRWLYNSIAKSVQSGPRTRQPGPLSPHLPCGGHEIRESVCFASKPDRAVNGTPARPGLIYDINISQLTSAIYCIFLTLCQLAPPVPLAPIDFTNKKSIFPGISETRLLMHSVRGRLQKLTT